MGARSDAVVRGYTGEEIPVLVDSTIGIPLRVPMRWILIRRRAGLSFGTLSPHLRAIGWLYEACATAPGLGFDLDERLLNGRGIQTAEISVALRYMEGGDQPQIVGRIVPRAQGGFATSVRPPREYNRIRSTWWRYLGWAIPSACPDAGRDHVRDREELAWYFTDGDGKPRPAPQPHIRRGLTALELEAIESVVCPDESGAWPDTFGEAVRERNRLMFLVTRWGGFRQGEMLKLYATDVPPPAATSVPLLDADVARHYTRQPIPDWVREEVRDDPGWAGDGINLERRPDDPAESHPTYGRRGRKPRVKTSERVVTVGDKVMDALRQYVTLPAPRGRLPTRSGTPYLFTARGRDGGWRPISVSTARQVIRTIAAAAGKWMAVHHPEYRHTLGDLGWHRFRHTRAMELLPLYIEEGEYGLEEFCEFFGWRSIVSAKPYVRRLLRKRGSEKLRAANARIDREVDRLRALRIAGGEAGW